MLVPRDPAEIPPCENCGHHLRDHGIPNCRGGQTAVCTCTGYRPPIHEPYRGIIKEAKSSEPEPDSATVVVPQNPDCTCGHAIYDHREDCCAGCRPGVCECTGYAPLDPEPKAAPRPTPAELLFDHACAEFEATCRWSVPGEPEWLWVVAQVRHAVFLAAFEIVRALQEPMPPVTVTRERLLPNCAFCGHAHWAHACTPGVTACHVINCHCLAYQVPDDVAP